MLSVHLHLIRHGRTPGMEKQVYLGATDEPLAPAGYSDVARYAAHGPREYQRIYTSPLQRAVQSAQHYLRVQAGIAVQPEVLPWLAERHFGAFEGKSYADLCTSCPQLISAWNADPWGYAPPEGESALAFWQRVQLGYTELSSHVGESERVLLFCHQGVIRVMLALILELQQDAVWRFAVAPGQGVHIDIGQDGYGFLRWDEN